MGLSLQALSSRSPFAEVVGGPDGSHTVFHLYGTDVFLPDGGHVWSRNALFDIHSAQGPLASSKSRVDLELQLRDDLGVVHALSWTLDVSRPEQVALPDVSAAAAGPEATPLLSPLADDSLPAMPLAEPPATHADHALLPVFADDGQAWLPASERLDSFYADSAFLPDVFSWGLHDLGAPGAPAVSVISDFNPAARQEGGDVLEFSDLLPGVGVSELSAYLHFESRDGGSVIHVSRSGAFAAGDATTSHPAELSIVLPHVDLTHGQGLSDQQIIQELFRFGKLVTEHT
ncbi:type I secretion C-terminal target domain-containing protein [Amphibiibacter pelophylacis]|uniref:Type I secretion C-terminal target domain-containing protein n=1 Tax=Amphibiibacter pelophylacis TaxID=1799477 RepID=A0ACC6P548_9BURK